MAMITTIYGDMDESVLHKTEGEIDNDNERTTWVEYRLTPDGEVIHRSASVRLKQGLFAAGVVADFG